MAIILAGIVFAGTLVITVLIGFANGMTDAPSVQGVSPMPVLIGGTLIAIALAASHWLPHIGW